MLRPPTQATNDVGTNTMTERTRRQHLSTRPLTLIKRRERDSLHSKGNSSASTSTVSSSTAVANSASVSSAFTAVAYHFDTYYGHFDTLKTCACFVASTFGCPEILPPPPPASSSNTTISTTPNVPGTLAHFIAYALHRTRLLPSVTFTALALLHRLKTCFSHMRGSSGHCLFLSAFMLASKVVCDDTYSNKSWAVVGQGMFALRKINQMEREMCGYLE